MASKRPTKVEVDGLSFTVEPDSLEDIETLDMLDEINEGNPFKIKKLILAVLGEDGWETAKGHLKDENGRVSAEAAAGFFGRVMEEYGAKNS